MQESFSKKQEKATAAAINSSPPLTSQKLPYHSSSTFSRENCLVLFGMMHKLQEKTLQVVEDGYDFFVKRRLVTYSQLQTMEGSSIVLVL